MSEPFEHPRDRPEAEHPSPEEPPSELDRPVEGDSTEYIEKGLTEDDMERRDGT